MIGIYKITNPNGKVYIGQSKNINKRKAEYKRLDCKGQVYIYNSLLKYGFDNHTFELLWSSEDTTNAKDILNEFERDFIYLYDCIAPNGMNLKAGGDYAPLSEVSKAKISKSNSGKKRSEEVKARCRENMLGKKMSAETRVKMSLACRGKNHWTYGIKKEDNPNYGQKRVYSGSNIKSVDRYNIEGTLVDSFISVRSAASITNINCGSISKVCTAGRGTAGGYFWKYSN